MAPEVLRGEPYSYSADWWSCGIILYEMLVGKVQHLNHNYNRVKCQIELQVEYFFYFVCHK